MTSLAQPARVLIDPIDGMGAAIEARRWVWPLVILAVCVALSGAAFALRWDAAPAVLQKMQMSGDVARMSEAEISDEITTSVRKVLVGGIAKGVFVMPFLTLMLACVLWVCAWLFGTPAAFGRLMAAAAIALLPIALYHLIFAGCALAQHTLTEARALTLVPSSLAVLQTLPPKFKGAAAHVDFFNLWSVGLLGLGFSSATGMRRSRALLLVGVLFIMYVGVFAIGLPAIAAAGGGGGGGRGGR
jgi:hypothetical protein